MKQAEMEPFFTERESDEPCTAASLRPTDRAHLDNPSDSTHTFPSRG